MRARTSGQALARSTLAATVAIWGSLSACGSDPASPTEALPERPAASTPVTTAVLPTIEAPSPMLRADMPDRFDPADDIAALQTRFLPSLEDAAAVELEHALRQLAVSAKANDPRAVIAALAAARTSLRDGAAGPADLDAVRRAIDALQGAVEASAQ